MSEQELLAPQVLERVVLARLDKIFRAA